MVQDQYNSDLDLARYIKAAKELDDGLRNEGLWLKAFSEASGNSEATKAKYISLRVEELRREAVAAATKNNFNPLSSDNSSTFKSPDSFNNNSPNETAKIQTTLKKDFENKKNENIKRDEVKRRIFTEKELMTAAIGPNAEYYIDHYNQRNPNLFTHWNKSAFFSSLFSPWGWLLYRKLYKLWIAIFFPLWILFSFSRFYSKPLQIISSMLLFLIAIALGLLGNYIYLNKIKKQIKPHVGNIYSQAIIEQLANKGGVNRKVIWFGWAIVIFSIVSFLVLTTLYKNSPQYDKNQNAKVVSNLKVIDWNFECGSEYSCVTKKISITVKNEASYKIGKVGFGLVFDKNVICDDSITETVSVSTSIPTGQTETLFLTSTEGPSTAEKIAGCLLVTSLEPM